ncbi:ATP-binding protein [Pseudoalteromonas mariniglutinosa]|uniref:ATP-binding protein n=1 Tax=Pseudoalteromonas mariniglutinosa TaxID=206042 RepID=UPI00031B2CFA|nr:ATP-binding protein [Pseudoalteromonas mariniglutinosa]MCF6143279.1 two-component system, OmpR family, sensor histidine kinase QseC [Pseudoalteromonas mariniglutinosa NCIMB 1770]
MHRLLLAALLTVSCYTTCTENYDLSAIKQKIKQGDLVTATTQLKSLAKQYPTSFNILLELASALRKNAQHTQAITVIAPLLNSHTLSSKELFRLHSELGINFRRILDTHQANVHYTKAKEIALQLNDKELLARAHANLGVLYDTQSNLALAMQEQTAALELLQNSTNWELQASVYYNLGDMSLRLNNLEQASHFFLRALESDKKSGDRYNIASTSLSLAKITIRQEKYVLAIEQLHETIEYLTPLNATQQLSVAYRQLAIAYQHTNHFQKALNNAKQSVYFSLKTDSPIYKTYAYMQLLELYLLQQDIPSSKHTLEQITLLLEDIDNEILTLKFHRYNARFFELSAQLTDAVFHYKKVDSYHNIIQKNYLSESTANHMKQVDALVQRQKLITSEQNNAITKAELKSQRLEKRVWLLGYSIIFILSILLISLYYIKHKRAHYKAKLYQASLDLKDKMLADISHELRTPLSVLKLNIEALEHDLQEDKSLAYLKINDKISQLNNLISDVYQLSQVDNCSMSLNNQVHLVSALFKPYADDLQTMVTTKNLTCVIDNTVSDKQSIYIDKQKLDQIIYNVFKNACLYTDSPGFVRLKVRLNPTQLFIQIDDSSPGVPQPQIQHLFERLYRIDSTRSKSVDGSGLGLSICLSLVNLMKGSISLHKGKFGGLCVRLLLPLHYRKNND